MPDPTSNLGSIGSASVDVRAKIDTFEKDLMNARRQLESFDKSSIGATAGVRDFESSAKKAADSTQMYNQTLIQMQSALIGVLENEKKTAEAINKHDNENKKVTESTSKATDASKEHSKSMLETGEAALSAGYNILKWTGYATLAARVAYAGSPAFKAVVDTTGQMAANFATSIPYVQKWYTSMTTAAAASSTVGPAVAQATTAVKTFSAIAGAKEIVNLATHFTGATAAAYVLSPAVRQVANQDITAGLKAIPTAVGAIAPAANLAVGGLSRLLPIISGAAVFLAPWVALFGLFVSLFELFKVGAKTVEDVKDKLVEASSVGFSGEVLDSYKKAFKEFKLTGDAAVDTFKRFAEVTTEKLGGSELTKTLKDLTDAGNFAKNAGVEAFKAAVTVEEKYKAIANLISVAISQRERLAALKLAETFAPPEVMARLRAFGDTLAVIELKAREIRKQPVLEDPVVQRALLLRDRLDEAYKILNEKFKLVLPAITGLAMNLYESWIIILEGVAAVFKMLGSMVDLIGDSLGPAFKSIGDSISDGAEKVSRFVGITTRTIGLLFDQVAEYFGDLSDQMVKIFVDPVKQMVASWTKGFSDLYQNSVSQFIDPIYDAFTKKLPGAFDYFKEAMTSTWKATIDALYEYFESTFLGKIVKVLGSVFNSIMDKLSPSEGSSKSWIDLSGAIAKATEAYEYDTFAALRNEQVEEVARQTRARSIADRLDEQAVINRAREATERFMKSQGDLSKVRKEESDAWQKEIDQITKRIAAHQAEAEAFGKGAGELEALRVQHQLTEFAASHHLEMTKEMTKQMESLAKKARDTKVALEEAKIAYDIKRGRESLLFTDQDVQIAEKLKALYPNMTDALESSAAAALRVNDALKQTREIGQSFVTDFVMGMRNGESALKSLLNAVNKLADKLLEMAIQQLWQRAFGQVLGGVFGAPAAAAGGGANTIVPGAIVSHSGGVIGSGSGVYRSASASMFMGAPRFHGGVNLASDEIPAILQKGERVIPKGGGRGEMNNNIEIHNHGADVQTSKPKRNQSGGMDMRIVVRSIVTEDLASGQFDKAHAQRYGLRPTSVRR